ncbi:hypothetical protein DFP73DRAFT_600777 [Morchella snyderi]|nr:hypothetical protein DFP73DRAFT_600777 [Morchella snyderi]
METESVNIDFSREFGMARYIYIGGDGAQLRNGYLRCVWINTQQARYLLKILELGYKIEETIRSFERFKWDEEYCYHGSLYWELVGKAADGDANQQDNTNEELIISDGPGGQAY